MSWLHDTVGAFLTAVNAAVPTAVPVALAESAEQVDDLLTRPPIIIVHLHKLGRHVSEGEVGKARYPDAFGIQTTVVARATATPLPTGVDALSLISTLIDTLTPMTSGVKVYTGCTPVEFNEAAAENILPGAVQWNLDWQFRRYP